MQVVIKKKALEQVIKSLAEERSFHSRKYDQIAGDDKPVLPDAQVATQLSAEQLPVGNPDFLPVNKKQAAAAAAQMTSQVDPAKLQKYFSGLKRLIRKTSTPVQQKGMSETDLMEAIRPFVLASAGNLSLLRESESVDDVVKAFKSKLGQSSWPLTKKNFENLVNSFDQDPMGLKSKYPGWQKSDFESVLAAMENPNWKPALTMKAPKEKAQKTPTDVSSPKKARAAAVKSSGPIEKIGSMKLDKKTQDELERLRLAWTRAPDEIMSGILSRQQHVPLDSAIEGDISQVIDVFKKAELPVPGTFAASGIKISVIPSVETIKGNDEETPVRTVKISKPGSALVFRDIKHTGGAIEATVEKADGSKSDIIYYIVDPYPFEEDEYRRRFEALFPKVIADLARDESISSDRAVRKAEDREMADLEKAQAANEKSRRAATMQKKLSLDLAVRDAVAMREENPKKLEKLLSKLSPPISLSDYDSKSDEEKDKINSQVVTLLDKERGPYYDVGDMDYLRDIFDEDAESRYSVEGESVTSNDPVAVGVEMLYETFFKSCFEPVMSYVIETMIDNNPDRDIDLSDVMSSYGLDSYEDFKDAVDDKDAWIDLVLDISKKMLVKDPDSFDNVMPDFGRIRKAVETKGDLSEFEGRMKILGIEDVGRLRSIFQYLKSPVAFMKAIKTTVQLQSLSGSSGTAASVSSPEKIKSMVAAYVQRSMSEDPTSLFASNKKVLMNSGINSALDLSNADVKSVIAVLGPSIEKNLSRALSTASSPADSEDVQNDILQAIQDFVLILDSDFSTMGDATNPASKPVLEYAKKFVDDVAKESGEPAYKSLAKLMTATIDGIMKTKKESKK